MNIEFIVPGIPVPKGSARAFVVKGRAVVVQDNAAKQKPWASMIGYTARNLMQGGPVLGPVDIAMTFKMPRPKSHFRSGKNYAQIKESAPDLHTKKPDLDKLVRCVLDALTGIVWKDDSQVASITAYKEYGDDETGVWIEISS